MDKRTALKELKKRKNGDIETFEFWMENELTDSDIKRFAEEKIAWNRGGVGIDVERLIAFQYACTVKGLAERMREIEKLFVFAE